METLYLLIPLSVVFVKYFPHLAREYDHWTGTGYFVGVATSKNMLGVLSMISALFFLWDTLARWPQWDQPRRRNGASVRIRCQMPDVVNHAKPLSPGPASRRTISRC
jgi:hypothetical protein